MKKYSYEIRQIDAITSDEYDETPVWMWNTSFYLCTMSTSASDHKAAFLRRIHALCPRLNLRRSNLYIAYDGDVYELRDRSDDRPILAAIPMF